MDYYLIGEEKLNRVTNIIKMTNDKNTEAKMRRWLHKLDKVLKNRTKVESNKYMERGTKIHKEIEEYLRENKLPKDISEDFKLVLPYLNMYRPVTINIEKTVFSKKHEYAGTLDALINNGKNTIIDWTTSVRPKKKIHVSKKFLQATAYAIAYEEMYNVKIPNIQVIVISSKVQMFNSKPSEWEEEWFNRLKAFNLIKHKLLEE